MKSYKRANRLKNTENPTCIDLILTKKPLSFKNTCDRDRTI